MKAGLLLLLLLAGAALAAEPTPAAIASALEPLRAKHGLPALGGAIVRGHGATVVGVTGLPAVGSTAAGTTSDPWHPGSCTKPMTSTLAAVLVQRGRRAWGTTLATAFPELADGMDPAWRAVTLQQLLSHSAGAPAELDADGLWGWLWKDEGTRRDQRRRVVEVGSNPMWFCVAWLAPARDLAVLVTTNAGHAAATRAADEAAAALLELARDE